MRLRLLWPIVVATVLQLAFWLPFQQPEPAPDVPGRFDSLSLAYEPHVPPFRGRAVDPRDIDRDLGLIARVAGRVRTYTASGDAARVPALARAHELDVTLGVWINDEYDTKGRLLPAVREQNRREFEAALELAREHPNVRELVVGNEVLLRVRMEFPDVVDPETGRATLAPEVRRRLEMLTAYLREAQRRSRLPVSTGEGWSEWIVAPELVRAVDFLTSHHLPFWEQVPADQAVAHALEKYDLLKRRYPGKRIVIGEFGWPSAGYNRLGAVPDVEAQARIVREFALEAARRRIAYNLIEAFDQPWKVAEGSVGAYWGVFDAARTPKFTFAGELAGRTPGWQPAAAALLGLVLSLIGLARARANVAQALGYAVVAQAVAAGLVVAASWPLDHYLVPGLMVAWAAGLVLLIALALFGLAKVHELLQVAVGRTPRALLERTGPASAAAATRPFVSLHVPACREEPEVLRTTLDSLARLDYDRYEVLVIVNNTEDERYWRPVQRHCAELGPRFKFIHLPRVAGYKAGALARACEWMAPEASVIGVVDADYQVHPDWLKDLVPAFARPEVALIQAPQDHRDGEESLVKTLMNAEYAGFFDIGMVQRNEDNALIAHGTMLLVRRSAFEAVGGWSSATIVEDTELGLRLLAHGGVALYTRRRYGWGLLPASFAAFKQQRHRWAYGALQIIRRHWRLLLPGNRALSATQKRHYLFGWGLWFSEALCVAMALLNLVWIPLSLLADLAFPPAAFSALMLAAVAANLVHTAVTYVLRVDLPARQIPGAALAAMSLQYTVALAVWDGLTKDGLAFRRTRKGGATRSRWFDAARAETLVGGLLLAGALWLALANPYAILEQQLFALTAAVQALPFLSATAMSLLDALRVRLPRRRATVPTGQVVDEET